MLMLKPPRLLPLLVVLCGAPVWAGPTVDPKTPARVSPEIGVSASDDSEIVSPLVLTPVLAAKLQLQILTNLQEQAGVSLVLAPVPPRGDVPNSWMLVQYDASKSDRELYWLFGQHLLMAQSLLKSRYADQRANGIDIARVVARQIIVRQNNGKLAGEILKGWVLPYYRQLEDRSQISPSRVAIANALVLAFDTARTDVRSSVTEQHAAINELIEAYRLLISVTTDESDADYARWQMAPLFERLARFDEGIACLREVNPRGKHRGAFNDIPRLEKERDEQQKQQAALAAQIAGETSPAPASPTTETQPHAQ